MKWNKFFIPLICLSLVVSPIAILNLTNLQSSQVHEKLPIPPIEIPEMTSKEIAPIDYWDKNSTKLNIAKINIKKKTTDIVNKYRLVEWDKYYSNIVSPTSINNEQYKIGSALNLEFQNYTISYNNNIYGPEELNTNNLIKRHVNKKSNIYSRSDENLLPIDKPNYFKITKEYQKQDYQFRYFNDFLLFFNYSDIKQEDNYDLLNKKNHKYDDLLYLRWLYYSASSSIKANQIVPSIISIDGTPKKLKEINFKDWMKAIAKCIASSFTNIQPILDIVEHMMRYYMPTSGSPIFTLLSAIDIWMRCSSKPQFEIDLYPLWEQKIKRSIKLFDLSVEKHWTLLENSLDPTKVPKDEDIEIDFEFPDGMEDVNPLDIIKDIKISLSKMRDKIFKIYNIKINLTDYTNIKGDQ